MPRRDVYPWIEVQVDLHLALITVVQGASTRAGERLDASTEKLFAADRESGRQTRSTPCGQPTPTASCDARNYCSWPALSSTKAHSCGALAFAQGKLLN